MARRLYVRHTGENNTTDPVGTHNRRQLVPEPSGVVTVEKPTADGHALAWRSGLDPGRPTAVAPGPLAGDNGRRAFPHRKAGRPSWNCVGVCVWLESVKPGDRLESVRPRDRLESVRPRDRLESVRPRDRLREFQIREGQARHECQYLEDRPGECPDLEYLHGDVSSDLDDLPG
ncbi:hypothetical protein CRENBAI_001829 [Crenichthys baileyi]|uniref:Uncharacterized protein n=1 Tax=Crenichthys baileyi TaxID=28760 RepID=A0AAV9S5R7_9TELE